MPKLKVASDDLLATRHLKYIILIIMGLALLLAIISIIFYSTKSV